MLLKSLVLPLVVCLILAIVGFIIGDLYSPPPGPYINSFAALCFGLMGIILSYTLASNLRK